MEIRFVRGCRRGRLPSARRNSATVALALGLALTLALGVLALPVAAEQAATPAAPAVPAEPAEEVSPTEDVTVRSQEALSALDKVRAELAGLGDAEREAEQVEQLQAKLDELLPEGEDLDDLTDNPALIDGVLVRTRALTTQTGALIDNLTSSAEDLEAKLKEIRAMITRWERVKEEATDLPEALATRVDDILAAARELESQAADKLNRVVELQNAALSIRNLITPIEERIDSYGRSRQTRLFEQNTLPIWALTRENLTQSSERATRNFAGTVRRDFVSWTETSEAAIGGHFLLLPLLLFLLFKLKATAPGTPSAALAKPVPSGVLIWMLIGVVVYAGAPAAVRVIYVAIAMLVAAAVLLNFLPKSMRTGVIVFVAIALTEQLFTGFAVTEQAPRLAYLIMASGLMILALLGGSRGAMQAFVDWGAPRPLISGSVWAAAGLLLVSVVANVVGYVHLAKLLMGGVVDSIVVFLVLFAGLTSISEIIEAALAIPSLDRIRSIAANRYRLQRALQRPLLWVALFLWAWVTTRAFGIDAWLIESISSIVLAEVSIGSVTLSLRGVVVFVFAVWLAVWTSRIVRAVLDQDVLPRMSLPRGIPNTISMTAHYTILMIGLLLGVGFMGIDLSSLAFIVGALGVGIGFGLQNVVNNFVSGLILIFEAPIQVGDTVEVGNLMGRVVQIGIRTSRVRTYSGSEVIVPNGDLVSNQVINWTLSDRRRRLELAVGVAYGSDPGQVTEILRGVLEANEDVLKDPEPIIVFSEFGDSALNFRIMAWIADFDTGFSMTHRINSAINDALAEAGITIPFPQRDLHLKSVPEAIPESLSRPAAAPAATRQDLADGGEPA